MYFFIDIIKTYSVVLSNSAGFPPTIVNGSTLLVTTLPAATTAPSPTVTPFKIIELKPIQHLFSIITGLFSTFVQSFFPCRQFITSIFRSSHLSGCALVSISVHPHEIRMSSFNSILLLANKVVSWPINTRFPIIILTSGLYIIIWQARIQSEPIMRFDLPSQPGGKLTVNLVRSQLLPTTNDPSLVCFASGLTGKTDLYIFLNAFIGTFRLSYTALPQNRYAYHRKY